MNKHNKKIYEEMVKMHFEDKSFEAFKLCFLAIMLFVVVVWTFCLVIK